MFVRFLRDFMSERSAERTPVRASGPRSRSRSPTNGSQGVSPTPPASSAPRARPVAATHAWIPRDAQKQASAHLLQPERSACTAPLMKGLDPRISQHHQHSTRKHKSSRLSGWELRAPARLARSLDRSNPPSPFFGIAPRVSRPGFDPGTSCIPAWRRNPLCY